MESGGVSRLVFEAAGLDGWDSALVAFVHSLAAPARRLGIDVDTASLPEGARRLVALAEAVPSPDLTPAPPEDDALTARVGRAAFHTWRTALDATEFLGEVAGAFGSMLRGRARFRGVDLFHAFEAAEWPRWGSSASSVS